jgi:hypothetical protein
MEIVFDVQPVLNVKLYVPDVKLEIVVGKVAATEPEDEPVHEMVPVPEPVISIVPSVAKQAVGFDVVP